MKKFFAILVALMMLFAFAACASHDCDICGAKGEGSNDLDVAGETLYYCDNCEEAANGLAALAGLAG